MNFMQKNGEYEEKSWEKHIFVTRGIWSEFCCDFEMGLVNCSLASNVMLMGKYGRLWLIFWRLSDAFSWIIQEKLLSDNRRETFPDNWGKTKNVGLIKWFLKIFSRFSSFLVNFCNFWSFVINFWSFFDYFWSFWSEPLPWAKF
jgi:hypothetical protein